MGTKVTIGKTGKGLSAKAEGGVALLMTAVVVPVILLIVLVCFDLSRMFLSRIFAQNLALLVAKIASSDDPDGYAFDDGQEINLIYAPSGENDVILEMRRDFWRVQQNATSGDYYGVPFFSRKDKIVLNLAYGALRNLNPRVYFPIPYGGSFSETDNDAVYAGLHNRVNCSVYFKFAPGSEPPAPFPSTDPDLEEATIVERDRIFYVDCAVPMIGGRFLGPLSPKYVIVSSNSYAFESGGLRR